MASWSCPPSYRWRPRCPTAFAAQRRSAANPSKPPPADGTRDDRPPASHTLVRDGGARRRRPRRRFRFGRPRGGSRRPANARRVHVGGRYGGGAAPDFRVIADRGASSATRLGPVPQRRRSAFMSPRKRPSCDGAPRRNWAARPPPSFWAFAWAGGLARYLLDHAKVEACDIDPFAFAAIRINAAANRQRGYRRNQPRWPGRGLGRRARGRGLLTSATGETRDRVALRLEQAGATADR